MSNSKNKYIKHIEESLIKVAPKKTKAELNKLSAYIGTKHIVLGIDTPLVRQMAKSGYGILENEKWINIVDEAYKSSNLFEVKNSALYIIENNIRGSGKVEVFDVLPDWINYTDNWAHSDYLSKFYTTFLELPELKKEFLNILKTWNVNNNLWKRRQSLVSLFYYARTKKIFLPYTISEKLIKNLLDDKEYFVQKGLGWALRESFNVYPHETYDFILKHATEISAVAFSASVEKMSIKQKEVLKTKRKKFRIKN